MSEHMRKGKVTKPFVILLCVALNLLGKGLAEGLRLPVWLDMIGTCIAACYTGPVGAVIAGVSCNILFGLAHPVSLWYTLTSLTAALALSFVIRKGWFENFPKAAMASFWLGILCLMVSTPLNLLLHGGYSGNLWGDALFDMLAWFGAPRALCALAGEALVEIVDKQICVLTAYGMIRVLRKRGEQETDMTRGLTAVFLAAGLAAGLLYPASAVQARAAGGISGYYVGTVYNNSTGMMSSEANVIEETGDGSIWIGSYAGLTRYDGSEFEFIRESGIVSVTCMLTDSRGRLWIGTNNDGVARYENGEFTFFTKSSGLPADSIRAFVEREDGSICVGTTDKVCAIDAEDRVETICADMNYIVSMAAYQGNLVCVSNNGRLMVLDQAGNPVEVSEEAGNLYYRCAKVTSAGLIAGTAENDVYVLGISGGSVEITERISVPLNDIVAIEEDREGRLWLCGEKGVGYLEQDRTFVEKWYEDFDSSFAWLHEDYQGNMWIASTRYGVLKLSESRFLDVFDEAGVEDRVVNAFVCYNGDYYCGTDNGLIVLDAVNYARKNNALTGLLADDRIRCLTADSKGRLWACTYGENGLVCFDGRDGLEIYNMRTKGTTSDRFRCAVELADGTIVAGTADGINFIRDGIVTGKLTAADGLANSQILSMAVGDDGRLYAGSDGAGIYVIEDMKIIENYTTEDGLTSGVILRIVPFEDGYLVVTGNALAFMGEEIRVVEDFPYFNNYDIMLDGDRAYVLSSAGIYEVNTAGLQGREPLQYRLYGAKEGLSAALTVNSWNYRDESGRLYVCTNSGVTGFSEQKEEQDDLVYLYGITSVICDGERIREESGVLHIPAKTQKIAINASVRSYALSDAKVRFFVEGLDSVPAVYDLDRVDPIQLTNFPHGRYTVRMQILDGAGENILSEKTYVLEKEPQLWENAWFLVYLALVCMESMIFLTWTALSILNASRRKAELEKLREELEEKVAEQMKEIQERQKETESLFLQAVTALSEAVDAKDRYTSGHSKRVAVYARMLAARMGKSGEEQEEVYIAGLLHDVGKIRIPETVINKPDSLNAEEIELFKIHPVTGYHILKEISGSRSIADGARFHHECYDGSGYPNGLKGEDIPEIARIIGVADAYDAMASNRSYRRALPQKVVRAEIEKGRGTQFDPAVADIMLRIIDEDKDYAMKQEENREKKILVIDNDAENIRKVEEILKDEIMCSILSAMSGEDALKILGDQGADLILLDIGTQGIDGFETFERIREHYDTPVVFMTESKDIYTIRKASEMGVADYLAKPLLPSVLKEIVQSVLNW